MMLPTLETLNMKPRQKNNLDRYFTSNIKITYMFHEFSTCKIK